MLKRAGEDEESAGGMQCPGMGKCDRFTSAAGETFDAKVANACPGCPRNCTPPVEDAGEGACGPVDEEIEELVDEIEDLIAWDDAGMVPDWELYGFGHKKLFRTWREAENFVTRVQQARIQSFILGWVKSSEQ